MFIKTFLNNIYIYFFFLKQIKKSKIFKINKIAKIKTSAKIPNRTHRTNTKKIIIITE